MLYSEQMKQIGEKLGVNADEVKDGLYSSMLQKIAEKCGGSGGGVSSWNDLTDRPFGEEEICVLPETKLTFEDMGGAMGTMVEVATVPSAGEVCTVVYNGEVYHCKVSQFDGYAVAFGNFGVFTGENTNEPFVGIIYGTTLQFVCLVGESDATVGITAVRVVPIPAKYAPKTVVLDLSGYGDIVKTNEDVTFQVNGDVFNELITASEYGSILLNVNYQVTTVFPHGLMSSGTMRLPATICNLYETVFSMFATFYDHFIWIDTEDCKTFTVVVKKLTFA
jgi:hypothetical protein